MGIAVRDDAARPPATPAEMPEVDVRPASRARRRWGVALASGWLVLVVALTATAAWLPLEDHRLPIGTPRMRPGLRWPEFLGTDALARSELSRLIQGARVSLAIGIGGTAIGLVTGGTIGVLAGYFRGKVDAAVTWLTNSFLAFPPLILLLAVASVLQPTLPNMMAMLGVLSVPVMIRLARANTLRFAQREFVFAARAVGARDTRILLREIVPNVLPPLLAYSLLGVAGLMVAEGGLSFLGFGLAPPAATWGRMISDGRPLLSTTPHLVLVPAAVMCLTVLSLNVVGDWLQHRMDR